MIDLRLATRNKSSGEKKKAPEEQQEDLENMRIEQLCNEINKIALAQDDSNNDFENGSVPPTFI